MWASRRCFGGGGEVCLERRGFGRLRRLGGLRFAFGGPPEELQHLELGAVAGVDEVEGRAELLVQDSLALLVFVAFHGQNCNTTRAEGKPVDASGGSSVKYGTLHRLWSKE